MVDENKKVHDMLIKSADVSDIIENPATLYNMFCEFKQLNEKFNKLKHESQFIWRYKDPNFLHMLLAPSSGSTHRFSMAASLRICDELLNITPVYIIPESEAVEYFSNPKFIKFLEVWKEQLFRFIHLLSNGSLIKTRAAFRIYCPHISSEEFMLLYRKYNREENENGSLPI